MTQFNVTTICPICHSPIEYRYDRVNTCPHCGCKFTVNQEQARVVKSPTDKPSHLPSEFKYSYQRKI